MANDNEEPLLVRLFLSPSTSLCAACAPCRAPASPCPSGVGGRPPLAKVVTGDILVDITGRNVSEYLLYTSDRLRLHRYGGLTVGNIQKSVPAAFGNKVPPLVRKIAVRRAAQVLYNNKGYHSMPTYLNVLNNAILRANLPPSRGNPAAYGITLTNHPMNRTSASLSLDYLLQGTDVVIAIFIIVAMSFVPASFVVFLVSEKSSKAKHLQFVSGCDPVIYWLSNYVWDMLNYLVPATCCVFILFVFDLPAYTSRTNFPAVLALFLLYGWSITPIMYPASFWFEVPSTAYVFLIVINLFIGITATVATFLLQLFEHDKDLKRVNSYLKSCFLIFPNYNLGHGLMEMAYNEYLNEYYAKIGQFDKVKSPFQWDIVTRGLVAMTIEGFVGFLITLLCQYNFLRKPPRVPVSVQPIDDDDEDVACERRRVLRGDADQDVLKIRNLTKVYKSRKMGRIVAVDRLCLGVRPGECFGLLGVNGAGKTSTFKMLTGDESTTGGEAFISGNSVLKELLRVQQSIGYCPQFDALFDDLTAREHLQLYTRLRGAPWSDQSRVVEWALQKLDLCEYADEPAGTYSGGNKRKLSTAIALIGFPPLIFLDEPTTGMDPKARRFLWNLILDIIKTGRSVVLTSHSMEECEALCTRLGIMVNGRFKCLGSIQHLKNRFGDGYMITVRTKASNNVKEVVRFFNRNFPEALLKERHHTKVLFQLKSERLSLAQVFSKMQRVVDLLGIQDYSVSQTTLDNVFVNFAKQQSDNLDNQQEVAPPAAGQSPLQRILSLLKSRSVQTELSALISDAPEEISDDEGLISFEEERASGQAIDPFVGVQLMKIGLKEYCYKFAVHQIDKEIFCQLTERDLDELIPVVGHKIKLRNHLEKIKRENKDRIGGSAQPSTSRTPEPQTSSAGKRKLDPTLNANERQKRQKLEKNLDAVKCIMAKVNKKITDAGGDDGSILTFLREKIRELKTDKKEQIGVFGRTGVGKSSLINAVIGKEKLLPTDIGKACTSVIIKLDANKNDMKYKAEVEFLSQEEFDDLLFSAETADHRGFDDESEVIIEKMTALFGNDWNIPLDTLKKSSKYKVVSEFIKNKKEFLSNESSAELSRNLQKYTKNISDPSQIMFWPVVNCVTIQVPENELLQHVTLVDLPGTGDSNKTRNDMWKKMVSCCGTVWVVTEVTRAASEKETWNILQSASKYLGNGGVCRNIHFICTKSDSAEGELSPEKFKNEISQNKDVQHIKSQFEENCFKVFIVSSKKTKSAAVNEIVKLQAFLHSLNDRKELVSNYISSAYSILALMVGARFGNVQQKMALYQELCGRKDCKIEGIIKKMDQVFQDFKTTLTEGVNRAKEEGESTMERKIRDMGNNFSTVQSVMKKNGNHRTGKGKQINLNTAISFFLTNSIDLKFRTAFPNSGKDGPFYGSIHSFSLDCGQLMENNQEVKLLLIFIKREEEKLKTKLCNEIRERKKQIYNCLTETVDDMMKEGYESACREAVGEGTVRRMQGTFLRFFLEKKDDISEVAKEKMLLEMNDLMCYITKTIHDDLQRAMHLSLINEEMTVPDVQGEFTEVEEYIETEAKMMK
uniref:ABC transporter domain-containing protein n=1 Tax=Knipowitschia caucasica TaxID=637954 RepID=A0AAV2MP22_KNICA